MTNITPPTLLGEQHVTRALADKTFFDLLPEYSALQAKMVAMHSDLTQTTGCGSCRKRHTVRNLYGDFMSITTSLTPDGVTRLKQYLGCQSLMINRVDLLTQQVSLKML